MRTNTEVLQSTKIGIFPTPLPFGFRKLLTPRMTDLFRSRNYKVRVAAALLMTAALSAQANVPSCGPLAARVAQLYALAVQDGFVLKDPAREMKELVAHSVGLSSAEFKKRFPGPYYEWFGREALHAYKARITDNLLLSQDLRARCELIFPESAEEAE